MQDKDRTLPTAFRLTPETTERFNSIAQDLGGNKQQAMARLIEVYEMEMGKERLPEMRANIDAFDGFIHAASNLYLQALETNQNMRALVRTEFEAQLRSKDRIIEELQERVDNAEIVAETASNRERDSQADMAEREKEYQEQISELEYAKNLLEKQMEEERTVVKEKAEESKCKYDDLNRNYLKLQVSEEELRTMLSTFMKENEKLKAENSRFREEFQSKETKISELVRQNESLTADIQKEKKNAEEERFRQKTEFEHYKKTSDTEQRLQLQTRENELKEKHKAELDELRRELDRYKELYYKREK